MTATATALISQPPPQLAAQASDDETLLRLWLHGRPGRSRQVYHSDIRRFLKFVARPLQLVTLEHLQQFADSLAHLAPNTCNRILAVVKSALAFGHRIGYLPFDVGRPLRLRQSRDCLAQRIMTQPDVLALIAHAGTARNRALAALCYKSGIRAAEAAGLCWRDATAHEDGGVTLQVFGKGGKTRYLRLGENTWAPVARLRPEDASPADPIFRSRQGGGISAWEVWHIIRSAARRAGLDRPISPHFLRHSFASHSLDGGEAVHAVQRSLGHASVATTSRYLHARPGERSDRCLPDITV